MAYPPLAYQHRHNTTHNDGACLPPSPRIRACVRTSHDPAGSSTGEYSRNATGTCRIHSSPCTWAGSAQRNVRPNTEQGYFQRSLETHLRHLHCDLGGYIDAYDLRSHALSTPPAPLGQPHTHNEHRQHRSSGGSLSSDRFVITTLRIQPFMGARGWRCFFSLQRPLRKDCGVPRTPPQPRDVLSARLRRFCHGAAKIPPCS